MYQHHLRNYLVQLASSDIFKQTAPLVIFLLIPTLVLTASTRKATLLRPFFMVLETLSLALPWNWYSTHSNTGSSSDRRKLKKKIVRTRADQLGLNGDAAGTHCDFGILCVIRMAHCKHNKAPARMYTLKMKGNTPASSISRVPIVSWTRHFR